jgi:hypothetical protein
MQPHSKSIHLVIVDRFVPDLTRKTKSVSGILRARAIRAWLVVQEWACPLALAARAALIEPARDIGFLPETNRSIARG